MQKLACLLLVVLIGFSFSAFAVEFAADEVETLYTFSGIPWSITAGELADAVFEAKGIVLQQSGSMFMTDPLKDAGFEFIAGLPGLDVQSMLLFCDDDEGTLSSIRVAFKKDKLPSRSSDDDSVLDDIDLPSLVAFDGLYKVCSNAEVLGDPMRMYVYCKVDRDSEKGIYLSIPFNVIDDNVYRALKRIATVFDLVALSIEFNNVSLNYSIYWDGTSDSTSSSVLYANKYNEEWVPPYIGSLEVGSSI